MENKQWKKNQKVKDVILPDKAWKSLSAKEKAATNRAKARGAKKVNNLLNNLKLLLLKLKGSENENNK